MKKHTTFLLVLVFLFSFNLKGQTGIDVPSMHKTDSLIKLFMQTWSIPGGTVAISKNGKLIYNRGFGFADQAGTEAMQPYHLLRIASNSKAITSIAIMKLVENGQLSLGDTVFGNGKILSKPYYLNAITDNRIYNITVKQLLEHTAGWDRDISCDGYPGCDPISFPLHLTSVMGEANPVGDSTLIKFLLTKGLNYAPGATYAYSNIGYLVLAKVIEQKAGMKYDAYVSSIIMQPLGLCDMHLGKNLLADKQEREGEYNSPYTTQSCYGNGATVPWQYGGWNLEAMNAHGGWISTTADYVRMILAVDGYSSVPDILNAGSVTAMTTPSSANANYAKGWSVNSSGNWWHMGALDGTSSFMCRTSGGYTWAFHFNSRGNNSNAFWNALDALPWNCIASTTSFPTHDLFAPATQASNLSGSRTSSTTVHLSWTPGSGNMQTVIATENNSWKSFPLDGTSYTGNATYGSGPNLGNNTYVVYSGSSTSVDVTGLNPAKTYQFTVLEGYNNTTTGGNSVYKYGCRSNVSINMSAATVATTGTGNEYTSLYPIPAIKEVTVENSDPSLNGTRAVLLNMSGSVVMSMILQKGKNKLSIWGLPSGVYYLKLVNGSGLKVLKQ